MFGKLLAERRLAGAAQPDQRDAPCPIGMFRPCDTRFNQLGQCRQFALRHLREQIEKGAERRGVSACLRQQCCRRQIERDRDRAQHADRRIAGAAFDLCEMALRGFGG